MKRYPGWEQRAVAAQDVVAHLKSQHKIFVHGAAATPTTLLDAMVERRDLQGVELFHLHLSGPLRFSEPQYRDAFISNPLFTDHGMRGAVDEGRAYFVPVFLSDVPDLFSTRRIPLDVALVSLSPPDEHGLCTLGTSVDAARAATEHATIVLAEINEQLPRTYGATVVPFERVTAFVHTNRPLHEAHTPPMSEVENRIGEHIAALVEDGSTLQMGIGAIPNAVLSRLGTKNDLGVHTEMFSDLLVPLMKSGVVTNKYKTVHRGRTVTSFVSGSRALFDFVDNNQLVEFHPCDRTNDTALIRQNPRAVAVNAALEIDLTGQVCADSIGHRIYSGIGGQMDFIRGAALSEGGKAIIALPSTAKNGQISRIVSTLKPGAGVVTTRGHVQYVATEYGIVDLHGLNLKKRAEALISIAHPDFRAELAREVREIRHFLVG
ncbi:acetyl-CoA hydrolase/transferase family protein [Ramlibacter sp.]|uniref:acetyl-CoA hydrolase/transferase family protein n=1 Tax=Ramlibacter sp. TaxID=1917967 RepID=UPI002C08E5C9|nr:acetyl-CoA hydrolase/transferase C-terminal domain-containing protein [Ramlibacter sp.]HWI84285.1 acetyl-CoA hydrolase/transferase C-terminal domain-containing protein [Ramlibacter sp.]